MMYDMYISIVYIKEKFHGQVKLTELKDTETCFVFLSYPNYVKSKIKKHRNKGSIQMV